MKLKFLIALLGILGMSFFTVADLPKVEELKQRIKVIEATAEAMRSQDADFADWVKSQSAIHNSYNKAYAYSLKHGDYDAESLLSEWTRLIERMEYEIRRYSAQPDLEAMGRVNVLDFGAKADMTTDDASAIQKAINFAVANGKGVVFIPKGKYLLKRNHKGRSAAIKLNKVRDLKILGEDGTVLVMESNKPPFFHLTECENVRFENFHLTALKPIFSTGLIVDYTEDGKGVIIKHDGGVLPTDIQFKECEMPNFRTYDGRLAEDGKTPILYTGPAHITRKIGTWNFRLMEHVKDDLYSVKIPMAGEQHASKVMGKGLRLVHFARNHWAAFTLMHSNRCRIKRVSMNRIGGLVIRNNQGDSMFVTDCTLAAAPEEKFSFSSCADFYYTRVATLGGYVARNVVKNMADDCFNLHSAMVPVLRQEGNVIYVQENWIPEQRLSEKMKYIKAIDIVPHYGERLISAKTRYKVLAAEKVKIKHAETYLNQSQSNDKKIVTYTKEPQDVTVIKLTLDRDPGQLEVADPFIKWDEYSKIRNAKKYDLVHFVDFYSQGQVIENNYFADTVGRCWIMGSGSVLKNNVFNMRYPHFFYCSWNEYMGSWDEAWYPRVVTYSNNIVRMPEYTAFCMELTKYNPVDPSTWMRHIYIENNRLIFDMASFWYNVKNYNHPPLFEAKGVADLELIGNTFVLPTQEAGSRLVLKDVIGVIKDNKYFGNWGEDKFQGKVELFNKE
ncbi:MAG: hypothetical protein IKD09_07480 [Lentisphaeria bacterium]|nr:hypothetical protein [Lentisphaeria bacterium]